MLLPFVVGAALLMCYDLRVRTGGLDPRMAADELARERRPLADADEAPEPREELIPLE